MDQARALELLDIAALELRQIGAHMTPETRPEIAARFARAVAELAALRATAVSLPSASDLWDRGYSGLLDDIGALKTGAWTPLRIIGWTVGVLGAVGLAAWFFLGGKEPSFRHNSPLKRRR